MQLQTDLDVVVAGQSPHIGAVLESPQHQDGLDPGGGGPLMRAGVVGAAVGGQPAADGTHSSDGYVESGTIGHPRGAFLASRFSWSKTTLTHGSACTSLRHTPPRPYQHIPTIPPLRPPAPPPPVRKPQWLVGCRGTVRYVPRLISSAPPSCPLVDSGWEGVRARNWALNPGLRVPAREPEVLGRGKHGRPQGEEPGSAT